MRVTVSRKAYFNAAHRLYRKDWSDAKNLEVFGKCSNPNYHGHNYELIVSVTGKIDTETGYVIDIKILKDIIKTEVEDSFDHKNLNVEVPEFKELNPTAENIAVSPRSSFAFTSVPAAKCCMTAWMSPSFIAS